MVAGILEGKTKGLSNDAAIVRGMEVNGNVIGVAGTIMAIAFSGQIHSLSVARWIRQKLAYGFRMRFRGL